MSLSAETMCDGVELPPAPLRRFTVDEYHRMIDTGVFGPDDRVELINGWIVTMSPHSPPHDTSIHLTKSALEQRLPDNWIARIQSSITLRESEPEPDVAIVLGGVRRYSARHPSPIDIGLVVEVSESSLRLDQNVKGPTYSREGIAQYWIVNIPERKLETYSAPGPHGYQQRRDYGPDESVPLVLDGHEIAAIPVRELLP
jgi:Uma2 family endonuclease